jgi:ABC-type nitrate/sulfonate/bicarbonate transport system substrate-binding protein
MAQIPDNLKARAAAECMQDDPYDFKRYLAAYVSARRWEQNPVEAAYQLERAMNDPRSEDERAWDGFCGETDATRNSDDPRAGW